MVKKKTVQGLIALAALLMSTGAAQAQDIFKDAQADVFVLGGESTLVDAQNWQSADRPYHSRFDLGPKFTLGVAVPYGSLFRVETAYSYGSNNFYVTNLDLFPTYKAMDQSWSTRYAFTAAA